LVNGNAAQQTLAQFELVLVFPGDVLKHAQRFPRDFRTDAIPREDENIQLHGRIWGSRRGLRRETPV
jgi:hypothetical protein